MSVTWDGGLDRLEALLRTFPADVTREIEGVIEKSARGLSSAMQSDFPSQANDKTGNLRRGNQVLQTAPLAWRVRNRAPHAWLYEYGFTHVGGKRIAGHNVFVPAAQAARAQMLRDMQGVLHRVATRGGLLT